MIAVFFAGTISDKLQKRAWLLYIGVSLETFALLFYSFATNITIVLLATIIMSLSNGFMQISQTTILADSTTSKEKNQVFSLFFMAENLAFGVGNLFAFLTFQADNSLSIDLLLFVIKIAFIFLFIEFILSLFVRDKYSNGSGKEKKERKDSLIIEKIFSFKIPVIVTISGFIISFGAGISIIFLNRFFNIHYGLGLDIIALLSAIMIFFTAFWGKIMGDLADKYGRIISIVGSQLIATSLLFVLSTYPPLFLGIITLLIRNAFMNASSPVSNALLTDNIPITQRARWTSVGTLGWTLFFSLGNALGGRIIDDFGFNYAFFITATLYFLGTLFLLFLKDDDIPNKT